VLLSISHCLKHLQHFAVCCVFAGSCQTGVPVNFAHVNVRRNRKVMSIRLPIRSHISVCEALRRTSRKFSTEGIVHLRTGNEDSEGK
jgi:ribosomal protein L16/L10AE